jgi:hypothetical protein
MGADGMDLREVGDLARVRPLLRLFETLKSTRNDERFAPFDVATKPMRGGFVEARSQGR